MSGTETRLRELLEAAVGEPPHSVSVLKVRRDARRRRTAHAITAASAAAACCAAVSVLALTLAAPLSGHSTLPRQGSVTLPAGLPRYYLQETGVVNETVTLYGYQRALVRSTASGAVTATVHCPWPGAAIMDIAPAGNETFFLACQRANGPWGNNQVAGSRLYRFQLTNAGEVTRYTTVLGGVLPGLGTNELTAAANGSALALVTSAVKPDIVLYSVLVINTRTGAHASWTGSYASLGLVLTLSPNGRDLRYYEWSSRDPLKRNPLVDNEECQVSPASRGGVLSCARVLVRWHLSGDTNTFTGYEYAQLNPEGSVLTVAGELTTGRVVIEQISVPGGRVIRVLFRTTGGQIFRVSPDPTGQYMIVNYVGPGYCRHAVLVQHPRKGETLEICGPGGVRQSWSNGWLDHGHLVPLTPAHGNAGAETW